MSTRWRWIAAYAVLTIVALVRVASTHRVFSETLDEPAHIAAGYDWVSGIPYTIDVSHPPLARALFGAPLKMLDLPLSDQSDMVIRGNLLLYHGGQYVRNLSYARSGNLVLLVIAIAGVALWGSRHFGRVTVFVGTALFTTLPPVLAHAGLATTDLAIAATLPFALLAAERYLEQPTTRRAAMLGLAIGIGLLAKYSFFMFFPAALLAMIAVRLPLRTRLAPLVATAAVAILVVWAGYQFDFGTIAESQKGAIDYVTVAVPRVLKPAAAWFAHNIPIPAPLFVDGFLNVKAHNAAGHESYLFGRYSETGFWYYFPVVWFFKTPLPFIVLTAAGAFVLMRQRKPELVLVALAILASAMTSNINIGIRHILPVYAPLALVAAHGGVELWRRGRAARVAIVMIAGWLAVNSTLAHPDYLAWFNEAAGPRPDKIAVDSNLDWGQDFLRLAAIVREKKIEELSMVYTGNVLLERHGIRARFMTPHVRRRGWIAASETALAFERRLGGFGWLEREKPVMRVGKSIRLYYLP